MPKTLYPPRRVPTSVTGPAKCPNCRGRAGNMQRENKWCDNCAGVAEMTKPREPREPKGAA
jgi:DnaJ-class molecular chaperone